MSRAASQRGKRIALICLAGAIAAAGFSVYLGRAYVFETWHLWRLDFVRYEGRLTAIEALGACGAERSVEKLVALAGDPGLQEAAVRALERVFPRLRPQSRAQAVEALLRLGGTWTDHPPHALGNGILRIGGRYPDVLPVFVGALAAKQKVPVLLAASVLLSSWEGSRDALEVLLLRGGLESLRAFLVASMPAKKALLEFPGRSDPGPPLERGIEIARWLGERHGDPRVRALALSFQVVPLSSGDWWSSDARPLARAYAREKSTLVKTAAIRLAGWLGKRPVGLDLAQVLFTEDDPALLTEAAQARTLWSQGDAGRRDGLELWEGFVCDWVPHWPAAPGFREPWQREEIERLEGILGSHREPALRDACSLALASRYRGIEDRTIALEPVRVSGFQVHEWGVWREAAESLLPAAKVLEDLPPFVHRSEVSAAEIQRERSYMPLFVFKPVVFFHAREPLSILVRVDFHGGRPWTFTPAATDSTERWGLVRGQPPAAPPAPPCSVVERTWLSPPWLEDPTLPTEPRVAEILGIRTYPHSPALRSFYDTAPWLVPNHPLSPAATSGGETVLSSMGLEWCGLRIGHDPELERALPAVDGGSWWARLREVPSQGVSVRGESERFLFYDGAVDAPGPLLVSWGDASKQDLVLRARSFDDFPRWPTSSELARRWWLSVEEKDRLRTTTPVPAAFVVSAAAGKEARGAVLENLSPGDAPRRVRLEDLALGEEELARRLDAALTGQGLTAAEARSLLETWRADFFRTPGVRVLTLLPRWMYDGLLPLEVFPLPEETVRVGLIWKECPDL